MRVTYIFSILFLFWFMWTLSKIENHLSDILYKELYSINDDLGHKLDSIESHLGDIKDALGGSIGDSLKDKLDLIENQLSSIESCLESR